MWTVRGRGQAFRLPAALCACVRLCAFVWVGHQGKVNYILLQTICHVSEAFTFRPALDPDAPPPRAPQRPSCTNSAFSSSHEVRDLEQVKWFFLHCVLLRDWILICVFVLWGLAWVMTIIYTLCSMPSKHNFLKCTQANPI